MTAGHPLILLTSIVLFVSQAMATPDALKTAEVADMSTSSTKLALNLLSKCSAQKAGNNVFLGPFSITTTLAMTQMGAGGKTAEEMKTVLQWPAQAPTKGFAAYLPLLQQGGDASNKGYTLAAAQRIYVNNQLQLKQDFQSVVQQDFNSDAKSADFNGNPEGERSGINDWVSDSTRGKITNLLPGGSINALTAMVLVQATYFKGTWVNQFDPKKTQPGDFYSPGGKVTVDMMQLRKRFRYTEDRKLECQAVELPYSSNEPQGEPDLSMLILLPEAKDGLDKLQNAVTQDALKQLSSQMRSVEVDLQLPRFKMESSVELQELLSDMGMPTAFGQQADFSGMVEGKWNPGDLYISKVFHKAVVEVNEEGSEAAAATAAVMMMRSLPQRFPFRADHPFLFFIVDKRADVVLFAGRMVSPTPSSAAGQQSQTKQEL